MLRRTGGSATQPFLHRAVLCCVYFEPDLACLPAAGRTLQVDTSWLCACLAGRAVSCCAPPPQVFNELPLEFAAEVNELMNLKLEGSVG